MVTLFAVQTLQAQNTPKISREVLSDIIKSIPSPSEISFLIKDLGVPYNNAYINDPAKVNGYKTAIKQALNLGVYATDAGYAYLYKKEKATQSAFEANMKLAKKLKIGHLFDQKEWKEKVLKSNNFDSLLLQSNTMMEKINAHFYETKQVHLTISMLTGGWLESLYITVSIAMKYPNEPIKKQIGEQKIILEQLLLLLSFYEELPEIKALMVEFKKLQKVYENVQLLFEYSNPTTSLDPNGILVVNDNTTTKVVFTTKVLKQIGAITKEIRAKLIAKD
jgi:hypothetical protein